ncbi:MAG: hypothetical protein ACAH11_02580 [Sphingomonas sp.]
MRKRITLLLATGAIALAGVSAAVLARAPVSEIVLTATGKPFAQTEAELAACLARNCAAPEDIDATIAHADNLFAAGQWKQAAAVFEASKSRNRKLASKYPVEVAGLLRAYGHISLLRGNPGNYRIAMFDAADALKEGLGESDPRVLVAQVEVVDVIAHDAMPFNTAENRYQALLQQAQGRGLGAIEGLITYRLATLYARGATLDRGAYERRALAACDALIASTRPEFAPYARAARSLRDTVTGFFGDRKSIERLVGAARNWSGGQPELLAFAPVEYLTGMVRAGPRFDTQTMVVAFWIQPDGRVRDNVTLFASAEVQNRGDWLVPIATSIQSRRYAPLPGMAPTDPGVLRVESFTLTSNGKGKLPTIEMRDLSDWAPMTIGVPSRQYIVDK